MSFIKRFILFNPAEATVVSFLLMSLVGAGILSWTEHDRMVHAKIPVLQETILSVEAPIQPGIDPTPRKEVHAYTVDTQYRGEEFIDAWFTAVSALCVTGLTSTDFSEFTLAGQIVTLILIQMGGLGIILFMSIFAYVIARGISSRSVFKSLIAGILDTEVRALERMLKHVFLYTFLFETTAFLIMGVHLQWFSSPELIHGINPWWWSLFHSISAFNNAGFGLLNNNLVNFVTDPVINLTIAALVILGGLGYPVLIAVHAALRKSFMGDDLKQKALDEDVKDVVASPVQMTVALGGTIALLFIGTFISMWVESSNSSLQGYSFGEQLLVHFFQSVSTRTAGFNTIDIGMLHVSTLVLYMMLMYIGANPAGTAGGVKIPTVAVLYAYLKDWFQRPGVPLMLNHRVVSKFALSHAIRLFFFTTIFIVFITFLICLQEAKYLATPDPIFNFTKVLFEVISAFGTVGLSMSFAGGVTSFSAILSPFSKFLLIVTMLFGRVGALTILAALPWKRRFSDAPLTENYPDAQKIQIG